MVLCLHSQTPSTRWSLAGPGPGGCIVFRDRNVPSAGLRSSGKQPKWRNPAFMKVTNQSGLIALQVVGALSILPYPFVLLANIMSLAAPGRTATTSLVWVLLSAYPLVWIAL